MSLIINATSSTVPANDVVNINIKGSITYYDPTQTISYSFLSTGEVAIFNGIKATSGDSFDFAGNVWTDDINWANEAHQAIQSSNEIIDLSFSFEVNSANSDLRWVPVNDPTTNVVGYAYLPESLAAFPDYDGQDGIKDMPIVIYDTAPWHGGASADPETGGGNERGVTMLHELGHFLGLSHPHNFNQNDAPFVELNDGKYDVMSYIYSDDNRRVDNLGNSTFGYGQFVNFSPTNIAALQHLYGANTNTYIGNNTYTLTDAGTVALDIDGSDGSISIGRAYYSIWDNGGIDEIVYTGVNNVLLNLNAATLLRSGNDADLLETLARFQDTGYYLSLDSSIQVEITNDNYYAGGFFSQILTNASGTPSVTLNGFSNTLGGYAIANGVVVENASGGSASDIIIGNQANNILTGNGGDDTIFDANGDDTVYGNGGNDIFYVGKGDDTYFGGIGTDTADLNSIFTRYFVEITGTQVTITDIIDNKYGANTFNDVESFIFAGNTFAFVDLLTGNQYEREYADIVNNDFVSTLGLLTPNSTNDTFWGTDNADTQVASLLNDLYKGKAGNDTVTFKGNLADFSFTIRNDSELVITNNGDATLYDVLHSIEQITFDDLTLDVTTLDETDLGLTFAEFTSWQSDYDFG